MPGLSLASSFLQPLTLWAESSAFLAFVFFQPPSRAPFQIYSAIFFGTRSRELHLPLIKATIPVINATPCDQAFLSRSREFTISPWPMQYANTKQHPLINATPCDQCNSLWSMQHPQFKSNKKPRHLCHSQCFQWSAHLCKRAFHQG